MNGTAGHHDGTRALFAVNGGSVEEYKTSPEVAAQLAPAKRIMQSVVRQK